MFIGQGVHYEFGQHAATFLGCMTALLMECPLYVGAEICDFGNDAGNYSKDTVAVGSITSRD